MLKQLRTTERLVFPPIWLLPLIVASGMLTFSARANDWPQWRGPSHDGVSRETGWSDQWPAQGPPIIWKANVGIGFSSFAVADGRVFTAGNSNNIDAIFCLSSSTGKVIWQHSYPADLGDKFFEGGTTGTPTVDGNHVFTLSRWGDIFCFDAATGHVVWSKNAHQETGVRIPGWGFGGSPLVFKNLLVLNIGQAGLALDKNTGKIIWQSASKDAGYSTPVPMQFGGQWYGLFGTGQTYVAVNLLTGIDSWRVRWVTQYGVNAADPIVDADRVFISTGYGKGAMLLKVGASAPQVIWKSKVLRTQLNPGVRVGAYVFGIDADGDAGRLKCIEFATGTQKWTQPGIGLGSLMAADGRLIVLSERGELMIAPATPEGFKIKAKSHVLGGKCWTVPVLANGHIYCRNSRGDVVCVDVGRK